MAADYQDEIVTDAYEEDSFAMYLPYDLYDEYDDLYTDCERCGATTFQGMPLCQACREEDEYMEHLEYSDTRGQRREAKRQKRQHGLVRHLPANVRPVKLPKPTISVKG